MFNNFSPSTLFTGQTVHCLPTCHSTNEVAIDILSKSEIIEGTLIITTNQTAGKGQRGNKWEAAPGKNLTFSIVFKPNFLPVTDQFYLNIISSLAIHQTLTHFTEKKISIKWPNDIYCNEKKISGILIQNFIKGNSISKAIIGIGLNVNQDNFEIFNAVSLKLLENKDFSLVEILTVLLQTLEQMYLLLKNGGTSVLKNLYLSNLYWRNEVRLFKSGEFFKGSIQGIDSTGKLIIEANGELKYFTFKEVEFVE